MREKVNLITSMQYFYKNFACNTCFLLPLDQSRYLLTVLLHILWSTKNVFSFTTVLQDEVMICGGALWLVSDINLPLLCTIQKLSFQDKKTHHWFAREIGKTNHCEFSFFGACLPLSDCPFLCQNYLTTIISISLH